MKNPGAYHTRSANKRTRFVMVVFLLMLLFDAMASQQLSVNPEQPTSVDDVSILVTGVWPLGGSPSVTQWVRDGKNIRIDAVGVLPGIPQPLVPYQLEVTIGRLPPGIYQADYFIEIYAAPSPGPTPGMPVSTRPNATISFEVLSESEPIPVLSATSLIILGLLLLLAPLVVPRAKQRVRS